MEKRNRKKGKKSGEGDFKAVRSAAAKSSSKISQRRVAEPTVLLIYVSVCTFMFLYKAIYFYTHIYMSKSKCCL